MCWEIVQVPENPPCSSVLQSTVHVIAATVEPKLANTLVRQLSQISPLENLHHVKRVRRRSVEEKNELSVILCPAVENVNYLEGIPDDVLKLIKIHQLSPFVARVAKYAASTKEEWEEQCNLWPTSYHPPTKNMDGISGFIEEDCQLICNFMKIAIEITRCDQLGYQQAINAAVIVDPSSRQIVASANDQTCPNMVVSNMMSKHEQIISSSSSDTNEVENKEDSHRICAYGECNRSYTRVSCLHPWKWTELKSNPQSTPVSCGSNYSWHPLRHAVIVAIENAAARDRKLFPNSAPVGPYEDDLQSQNSPAKRQKIKNLENEEILIQETTTNGLHSDITRPYLCTGYDIYLVWEPCTMCAMALVHQRIRRIFYAFPNPNAGALGSVHRLQGVKSLNHHYSVFRIMLPEEDIDK